MLRRIAIFEGSLVVKTRHFGSLGPMTKNPSSEQSGRRPKKLEVTWEFEPTWDAKERLQKAFEMLLRDRPETTPDPEPRKKQGVLFI